MFQKTSPALFFVTFLMLNSHKIITVTAFALKEEKQCISLQVQDNSEIGVSIPVNTQSGKICSNVINLP